MFNTLKYARKLEEVGLPREQAEAHVQIISEIVEGDLASKQDVALIRSDVINSKTELEHKMVQLEYRLIIKIGTIITVALGAIATFIKFF